MAYAGAVRGVYGMVQLHTSGRYNKRWDVTKYNGTKIGTVHDFSLYRTARLSAGGACIQCYLKCPMVLTLDCLVTYLIYKLF